MEAPPVSVRRVFWRLRKRSIPAVGRVTNTVRAVEAVDA